MKKVEVLIIENDYVIHHTSSQVYPDSNTYNVVIQALIESITGPARTSVGTAVKVEAAKAGFFPLNKPMPNADKFAQAVPSYVPPERPDYSQEPAFHPDLVKEGVAPKVTKAVENGIPVVKLSMKEILKGAK